jgi:hypothetical protein
MITYIKKKVSVDFPNSPPVVHDYDTFQISTTDYSNQSILQLFVLKIEDHMSTFKTVMESFDVEMVNFFKKTSTNFSRLRKNMKCSCFSSFLRQIAHDHIFRPNSVQFLEYVWARCKFCHQQIGEVRVCEGGSPHKLVKVHSVQDTELSTNNREFGCKVFDEHLNLVTISL